MQKINIKLQDNNGVYFSSNATTLILLADLQYLNVLISIQDVISEP